ncbi:MAG TPA: 2-C-methyl-D-erythritol 4-phosphate cytidylyltransferase [Longimicrobiales bacterium]
MNARSLAVVIPAAGVGRRMGGVRKQFLELAGEPMLLHTLRPFLEHPDVRWVIVALSAEDIDDPPTWLRGIDPRVALVRGGAERAESVMRALSAVPDDADVVLVHDAARPLVTRELIDRTVGAVRDGQGAIAALPISDTVKRVVNGAVVETPDRSELYRAQTPQAFPRALLAEAYRAAALLGRTTTDDAAVVERYGKGHVVIVEGDPENLKVTDPADMTIASALLARRAAVHR